MNRWIGSLSEEELQSLLTFPNPHKYLIQLCESLAKYYEKHGLAYQSTTIRLLQDYLIINPDISAMDIVSEMIFMLEDAKSDVDLPDQTRFMAQCSIRTLCDFVDAAEEKTLI